VVSQGEIPTQKTKTKNKKQGEWLKGKYHGRGKLVYADGRRYDGEWFEV
jgi:hypothetical protein